MASESRVASPPFATHAPAAPTAAPPAIRPASLSAWRVGQVLSAMIAGQADSGHAWLHVNGTTVRAQVPHGLPAGTLLRLRVKTLGSRVMLEIVDQDAVDTTPLRAAIRGLLPRQSKLAPLLANLTVLTAPANAESPAYPAPLTAAAQQLFDQLPHAARLGFADALQAALNDSGVFLEARLAQAALGGRRPAVEYDFKAGLLRFMKALRVMQQASGTHGLPETNRTDADYPPLRHAPLKAQSRAAASLTGLSEDTTAIAHLKGQVDGALARLELTQLSAHPADGGGPSWLFELPVRHGTGADVWQMRLARDGGQAGAEPAAWTVTLSFALGELGPVQARVSLRGAKVSTLFWAERAATADTYSRSLGQLAALYQAHGLTVGALACHVGEPHAAPPQASGLLDLRA